MVFEYVISKLLFSAASLQNNILYTKYIKQVIPDECCVLYISKLFGYDAYDTFRNKCMKCRIYRASEAGGKDLQST